MTALLDPPLLAYREAYDRAALRWDNAPPWFSRWREASWRRFTAAGFPAPQDEEWKYTPVSAIEQTEFRPAPETMLSLRQVEAFVPFGFKGAMAVFVNGRFQPAFSRLGRLPEGSRFTHLRQALALWPAELEPHLLRPETEEANPFAALNGALAEDGAYLRLLPGTTVDEPVLLLHLASGNGMPTMAHLRHLVVAEANSRLTLLSACAALGETLHFSDTFTGIAVGQGAEVDYLKLQQDSLQAYPFAQLHARVAADARFSSRVFSFGGRLAREDIHVELAEPGAACALSGLYLADGRQHTDTHTRIDHLAPRTASREEYRGILAGRGRGVFDGRVVVARDAQQTDARQANHNLLLSRDAEIDTKPQLEIYADDVKCSHGATVGQLDENQVFYLRSRGLDETAARAVLTYAFAADMVQAAASPCLRETASRLLLQRLPGGELAREFFHEA